MKLIYRYWLTAVYSYVFLLVIFYGYLTRNLKDAQHFVSEQSDIRKIVLRPSETQQPNVDADANLSNKDELQKLGAIIRQRLHYIQNPVSCKSRRKVQCQLHPCGLGCTVNTISNCLMIGYALNRTVVVSPPLRYPLKPLSSTCQDVDGENGNFFDKDHEKYQIIYIGLLFNQYKPNFYPPAVPDDLFERIHRYHDDQFLWWTSIISNYVFQLKHDTYKKVLREEYAREFRQPTVGVQIRRTDKLIRETKLYTVDKYMVHVDRWFKERPGFRPTIFLATDDPNVSSEILEQYPHYKVISNINYTVAAAPRKRMTEIGQFGIIHDIYFLSKCDFLVCTFSSNVCRLAYQLMIAERGNVSNLAVSIDEPWYFYGQRETEDGKRQMLTARMPDYPENL